MERRRTPRPRRFVTAAAALKRGEAEAALRAASDACRAEPDRAECHYVYGQAWAALGRPEMAERAFAEAIRRRPDFTDAWINYGLARYAQGATGDAKAAMLKALDASPGHPAALSNLAAFLRITGEAEAAETLLRAALVRDADAAAARLNLVADLLTEERSAEALALLDEAEPPQDAPDPAPLGIAARARANPAWRRAKRAGELKKPSMRWDPPRRNTRRCGCGARRCSRRSLATRPARATRRRRWRRRLRRWGHAPCPSIG